jgi:long-chain fatty acid transport protein
LRSFNRLLILISALALVVTSTAFGAGFAIFEQGAKAVAMGGAFAATADDPSAIFYNVAGIAQQRRAELLAGGTVINFSNSFKGDPNDLYTSGTTGQYRRHTFIPPNAYFILPVGSNVTVGLGTFSNFGLRTNWQEPWVGRFVSRDANVKTVSVEPAIAFQTSDGRLAVGVGAEYRRSHIVLNRDNPALNPFTGRIDDVANAFLNSKWDSAWGYNVGLLFKPTSTLRVGAAYRSHIKINYTGTATFTQISACANPAACTPQETQFNGLVAAGLPPNQSLTTSIDFPDSLTLGIATSAIGKWDIEADINRMGWSSFKSLDVIFSQTPANNLHRIENWKTGYSYRIGGNRPVTEHWDVRLGALYDKNPEPTDVVGPLLPDADRIGATFGVGYHKGPIVVDVTEFALHFKTRSTGGISSDNLNGTYKTDANLVTVNLGYKF